jgi:chromosome segregation ATPase
LKTKNKEILDELTEASNSIEFYQENSETQATKISDLESLLQESRNSKDDTMSVLRQSLARKDEEISTLKHYKDKVQLVESEKQSLKLILDEGRKKSEYVTDLKKKLEEKEKEIAQLKILNPIPELQEYDSQDYSTPDSTPADLLSFENLIRDKNSQIQSLTSNLENLTTQNNSDESHAQALLTEVQNLTNSLSRFETRNLDLENDNFALISDLKSKSELVDILGQDIEGLKAELEGQEREIENLR